MTESCETTASSPIRLRLDLAYDGTSFHGWAAQPGLRTVQEELERAIAVLLRTTPDEVRLTVGGRTDAGVHARGQVAHLDVTSDQLARWVGRPMPSTERAFQQSEAELRARRLNGVLKRSAADVVVHSASIVPAVFDARFSALKRRYEYRVRSAGSRQDPLSAPYTADAARPLDFAVMHRASHSLLGLRDFTTFCKAREGASAVRTLITFDWRETDDGAYAARIEADAFCHSMVRALIGAIVAVGSGRITETELGELTDARERTSRFVVMPAHGLSLEEITYPENDELAQRAERTRAKREPLA